MPNRPRLVLAFLCLSLAFVALYPNQGHAEDNYCSPGLRPSGTSLCYPACREGYKGVGPLCWQKCSEGFTNYGVFCGGGTYGRGAGKPLRCGAGEERKGGLCYPKCRPGYVGKGPVCWRSCPAGYHNDGALCRKNLHVTKAQRNGCPWYDVCGLTFARGCTSCPAGYKKDGCTCRRPAHVFAKKSYGRGAGRALHTCAAGSERSGSLCYRKCRTGHTGRGPVCWRVSRKDRYRRGVPSVRKCSAESFTRAPEPSSAKPFTMIVASDTQLVWGTEPGCKGSTEQCEKEFGIKTNRWFVQAMNNIQSLGNWPSSLTHSGGTAVTQPKGVIINGDLTAFWHSWQVRLYRKFYDPEYAGADPDVLKWPLYPGLGNHDYANNVGDCMGSRFFDMIEHGSNACAAQAVRYMRGGAGCGTISNFPQERLQSFDRDSMAYSWNEGGWHFVQLHNYPTYAESEIGIESSIDWLRKDLASATAAGQKIVLNMHDATDHWDMNDAGFQEALRDTNTVAVFAGHLHATHGVPSHTRTVPHTTIPLLLSGSAETSRFLLVEFREDAFSFAVVHTEDGTPSFASASAADLVGTFEIIDVAGRFVAHRP